LVLFAEYLLLAVRLDGGNIQQNVGDWGRLSNVGASVSLAAAAMSAGLLLRRDVLLDALAGLHERLEPVDLKWASLHALAFGLFGACSGRVFAPFGLSSGLAPFWVTGWLLLGMATAATLLRATFGRAWWTLARALLSLARGGFLLGAVAFFVGAWSQRYWPWLAGKTLLLAGALLSLVSKNVYLLPREACIGLDHVEVEIAQGCSGIEGISLVLVLFGGYLYSARTRLRFPRALMLLPLAVAAVWLLNGLRVAVLVAVAAWVSPAIAFGGFHSKAGWIAVCSVALGAVWLSERSSFFAKRSAAADEHSNSTAVYCMPLLSLLALGMLTSAFADRMDWLYGVRLVGAAGCFWYYRREYVGLLRRASGAAILLGAGVCVLWVLLAGGSADTRAPAAFVSAPLAVRALWLALRVLGTVMVVPVAEELAFRGYLQRRLISADFETVPLARVSVLSFCVSALAFGALHENVVAGTLAGIAYSLAGYRRGELVDCVAAHATTNAALAVFALVGGRWDLMG
jgi:exosortase E/protease (VPEID-CTERM system)